MSAKFLGLLTVTAAFAVLSAIALVDVGYFGIIEPQLESWGAGQVLVDLVIVAGLAMLWMVNDSRERGINPWPYVVLTLVAGSFGPLAYLIVRELRSPTRQPAMA